MARPKKEHWFTAICKNGDDREERYFVYRKGRSITISSPNFYEHLCHPSVGSEESVLREILLVWQAKVDRVEYR